MRLLVVEDQPRMARLLRRGLEEEGYSVELAHDGPEAIWAATEADFDAIVLDVMLPGCDGFKVCRRLREAGRWAPVLMLTARDAVPDRIAGLDSGADDYLVKPFSFGELSARLRALVADVDEGRLLQAFCNLLSNADRASPPGAAVTLRASAGGVSGDFEVTDEGSGFPPDFLPRAFERFSRVDSSRARSNG